MAETPLLARFGSVRLRITLVAMVVTGIATFLASSWLVDTVHDSMTDRLHSTANDQLTAVRHAIESGRAPKDLDLAALAPGGFVQIVDTQHGIVANATPGIGGYPPLYSMNARGDVIQIDPQE